MSAENWDRFKNLTFDSFKKLAQDESLSSHEKIGFPDSYREGKGDVIFNDILGKLSNLSNKNKTVLDIGPGCGDLAFRMIRHCAEHGQTLLLVDCAEMLRQLPEEPFMRKFAGRFPSECPALFEEFGQKVDAILAYSLFQIVFAESNGFKFLDRSLSLLADGGELLIGDIPNISKRKRFFSSPAGIRFHQEFMETDELPKVEFNAVQGGANLDDAALLSLVMRCRNSGFDAYWVPQAENLPMANRREDLLIKKP